MIKYLFSLFSRKRPKIVSVRIPTRYLCNHTWCVFRSAIEEVVGRVNIHYKKDVFMDFNDLFSKMKKFGFRFYACDQRKSSIPFIFRFNKRQKDCPKYVVLSHDGYKFHIDWSDT